MDTEKLIEEVKKIVASELEGASKEDSFAKVKEQINELSGVIENLTEKVALLDEEKAQLASAVEELEGIKAANEESLKSLTAAAEEASTKLEAVELEKASLAEELEAMRAEIRKTERLAELEQAGLLLPEGELRDGQSEKASSMSDEAFEAYKSELNKYKEIFGAKEETASGEEEGSTEPAPEGSAEGEETASNVVPPADIEGAEGSDSFVPTIPGSKEEASTDKYAVAAKVLAKLMNQIKDKE